MTKRTIASAELKMDALSLGDFIGDEITNQDEVGPVVYVQDQDGRIFTKVRLIEETLTDGSKVHNLILSE